MHTVWGFWEVYSANSWNEVNVILTVGSWYIATIIGCFCGACLIPHWPKKRIYVSGVADGGECVRSGFISVFRSWLRLS